MSKMIVTWMQVHAARFGRTERAASLVEYALLLGLIALVCIAAITLLGDTTSSDFSTNAKSVADAGN